MRVKWITGPVFLAGLLALATVDSQGQPPSRERGGDRERGDRGDRGRGRGGFSMDPNAMWDRMSQGQDSVNLNDPRFSFMKRMAERSGRPLPPNGILTKQQFVADMQQRMAQRGSSGGPPGRFTPPGGSTNTMTFQATPGPGGKPVITMSGGPTGAPGSDEMMQTFFRRSDHNGDGRIDRDEATSSLRDRFQQFDTNRDGTIDFNEYRPYMQERFANRGDRGPGGSFDPRYGSMSSQYPGGWGGSQAGRDGRSRNPEEERPTVIRYGKLPKGLPSWFEELDTDQDGQVGLYEWRRAERATKEFVELDLNADGYLTADEWLRHQSLASARQAGESESGSVGFGGAGGFGAAGGRGGFGAAGSGARFQYTPGNWGGDRTRPQPGGERGAKERNGNKDRGKDRATYDDQTKKGDRPRKGQRRQSNGD
ncbi:MAG TPA: EF-hand domain-containing protein [Fimbriiglobus sp.]|nr:EF-hand domain-containing protein [Fimbriiglobus sp.]